MNLSKSVHVRIENLMRGRLKNRLVFVHIPKCGGTSISSAIKDRYKAFWPLCTEGLVNINAEASLKSATKLADIEAFSDDFQNILRHREHLLFYFMCLNSTNFIHGHICFSVKAHEAFKGEYAFITLLRDPVKRWISAFFYNKYRDDCDWKIKGELDDYLESSRGKANGYEYVKKLVGEIKDDLDYSSVEAIELAKSNLDKFVVVGFLEDLESFKRDFYNAFGIRIQIKKTNQGPKTPDFIRNLITTPIEERIRELCQPDIAVYQYAINKFLHAPALDVKGLTQAESIKA